ncbi:VRR-NUC domain-containing protein [Porphyromonadaceae bacterium KH3CP3RA]|nr:VRR-NUC domain-containing protein [Porphyromonadaceae bacterium KH3CP3RA]
MDTQTCISCKKETVSVVKTDTGYMCYQCYMDKKDAGEKKKRKHSNEEADIQSEFFKKVKLFFPHIPEKLIFAVPNGGSRNKIEAANLKKQGVRSGVADVILLIPKKGFASLCMEFKTKTGRQSPEQKEFQKQAETCGSKYVIVRSVKEAIEKVREYLK